MSTTTSRLGWLSAAATAALLLPYAGGCSKHEFSDPTAARAAVVYDHSGTAQGVSQHLSQPQATPPKK